MINGQSRLLPCLQTGLLNGFIGHDLSDYQADSAGSIPVTRSTTKDQVKAMSLIPVRYLAEQCPGH